MISDEQLRFAPREGMWSLGTAARHIANAEDGWFRYVVTRNLDEWPVFDEEEISTVADVKKRLTEVHSCRKPFYRPSTRVRSNGASKRRGERSSLCDG